jgi:hypothetical protein
MLRNGLIESVVRSDVDLTMSVHKSVKRILGVPDDANILIFTFPALKLNNLNVSLSDNNHYSDESERTISYHNRTEEIFLIPLRRSLLDYLEGNVLRSEGANVVFIVMYSDMLVIFTFRDGETIPNDISSQNIKDVEKNNFTELFSWEELLAGFKDLV